MKFNIPYTNRKEKRCLQTIEVTRSINSHLRLTYRPTDDAVNCLQSGLVTRPK